MKILLVTQWYDPEPVVVGSAFVKQLERQGLEVQVVTGFPNYPYGKIYQGYRLRWFQKETLNGTSVHRLPLYPSHSPNMIARLINYLSFALSLFVYSLPKIRKFDVVYTYHPPIFPGVVTCFLCKLLRVPIVLHVQDMWPEGVISASASTNKLIIKGLSWLCNWTYRNATHVVVLSPGFTYSLQEKGCSEQKLSTVFNWCDEDRIKLHASVDKDVPGEFLDDSFKVLYAGNIGKAQNLGCVVDAAKILEESFPGKISIILMGGGLQKDELQKKVTEVGVGNVAFADSVPIDDVGYYLSQSDVLLVHLRDDPLFKITIPSKTQSSMYCGKPVIIAVGGDANDLVERAECGIAIEPEDPVQLASAIERLYQTSEDELLRMGSNGKDYYQQHLSVEAAAKQFVEIFEVAVKVGT